LAALDALEAATVDPAKLSDCRKAAHAAADAIVEAARETAAAEENLVHRGGGYEEGAVREMAGFAERSERGAIEADLKRLCGLNLG
jgi:hypothetical protein